MCYAIDVLKGRCACSCCTSLARGKLCAVPFAGVASLPVKMKSSRCRVLLTVFVCYPLSLYFYIVIFFSTGKFNPRRLVQDK